MLLEVMSRVGAVVVDGLGCSQPLGRILQALLQLRSGCQVKECRCEHDEGRSDVRCTTWDAAGLL